ncbi:hypothetical protein BV25DRAFT_1832822 [Artomyces pyxidatus]|uniref:Uncharacterized protein n=1 Tax=Artomyces pyxidatus TaxID=48021 RepID=A0ACB8SHB2_9AGAM|nr:hypothetical protein BV25DRAFT_1832822 [Artomyces pyxidatus]
MAASEVTEAPHGTKRQRTGDVSEAAEVQISQSAELWLPDGNIVIRTISVGPPLTHTLYKVHKHVLALHCSAFASLFNGPQGALDAGSEHHDGTPIMDLQDAPEDARNFLKALYFPKETQLHLPPSDPFRDDVWAMIPDSYHGILRLAVKYDAADIRDIIVKALKTEWPSSLSQWEFLRTQSEGKSGYQWPEGYLLDQTSLFPNPAKIIQLATDCNVPDLLPAAYYDLACVTEMEFDTEDCRSFDLSPLSKEALEILIRGKISLRSSFYQYVVETGHACLCNRDCMKSFRIQHLAHAFGATDAVAYLSLAIERVHASEDASPNCRKEMERRLREVKHHIWAGLPYYFRLTSIITPSSSAVE